MQFHAEFKFNSASF